jgi:hypothetical protein
VKRQMVQHLLDLRPADTTAQAQIEAVETHKRSS